MMLKMTKDLMLVMMLADRDVRMLGEVDVYEACKDTMEETDVIQEVPDEMLVMRDDIGEDNDAEDGERLDAVDDAG